MTGITNMYRYESPTGGIVEIITTDTTATALASNYITNQASNIVSINNSSPSQPFQWYTNDLIILKASDGDSICVINSLFTTLSLIASEVIPLPMSVANGLTAHAGGGQSSALQLAAQLN